MFYAIKSAVLLGLVATSLASPIQSLQARAKVPAVIDCDGTTFTAQQIRTAIDNSYVQHGKYPEKFGNKAGGSKVFPNIPDANQLWSYPLTAEGWTTGEPGKFRVVMNDGFTYMGTMIHIGGVSNSFKACVPKPEVNPPNPPEVNPPNVNPPNINPPNLPN